VSRFAAAADLTGEAANGATRCSGPKRWTFMVLVRAVPVPGIMMCSRRKPRASGANRECSCHSAALTSKSVPFSSWMRHDHASRTLLSGCEIQ
jgi:hypothetical protein